MKGLISSRFDWYKERHKARKMIGTELGISKRTIMRPRWTDAYSVYIDSLGSTTNNRLGRRC